MIEDAVVILGDVCGSRKMKMDKRYEAQLYLKSGIIQLNESFYNLIEAPFMITRGDEFQGILKNLKSALLLPRSQAITGRISTGPLP